MAAKINVYQGDQIGGCITGLFAKSKALIDNVRSSMDVVVNAVTVYTSYLLGIYDRGRAARFRACSVWR